jgi:glycosyltransferase involved in cell wall biosynthesis
VSLLTNLIRQGLVPDKIFSTLPVERWPRANFQSIRSEEVPFLDDEDREGQGVKIHFLGCNNIEPMKTLSIGFMGFIHLYRWCRAVRSTGKTPVTLMYNLGPTHHMAPFFVLACMLGGGRLVSLVTDLEPRRFTIRGIVGWLSYCLQVWSLRQMDGLLPLNMNVIRDLGYDKAFEQVFGILPSDEFALKLSRLPLPDFAKPIFLFSGSLNEVRGISLLLEAFSVWDQADAELLITGRGNLESLVREYASRDSRIQYLGFLKSEDDLLSVYERASYVINPHRMNHFEARYVFPSKLTEYMASGRYVISSNHGEIESEYSEIMSIYTDDSAIALKQQLSIVVRKEKEALETSVKNARDRVLSQQLWKHHSLRIIQFLENLG